MHKMMSKKIVASIVVVGIQALAIGWGTYSYFSDTETSSGNTFSAGTLDLKVNGQDGPLPIYFNVGDVKPGDSGSVNILLSNTGSLSGEAILTFTNIVDSPGTTPEPEILPDMGELSENLCITIYVDSREVGPAGPLAIIADQPIHLGPLGSGQSISLTIKWHIPSGVGNVIMGDSVTFDIEFSLVQA